MATDITQDSGTEDAVLCTHGETLAALFRHWQSHGRLRLGLPIEKIDKSVAQKSGAWIMEDEGVLLRGRYLPAPDLRRRQGSAPRSSRPRPS